MYWTTSFRIGIRGFFFGYLAAAMHDHQPVGDGKDFRQGMADQDHRNPVFAQFADKFEHFALLGNAEVVCRLVHDHQLGVPVDRARDGDSLALTPRKRLYRCFQRGNFDIERTECLFRLFQHESVVQRPHQTAEIALFLFATEKDIARDIKIIGQRQILVDRLDPPFARFDRAAETHGILR